MTIKEIADLAGTSRGTVDRVLNGRGKVSPELAAKIRAIAETEDYQPNQLARALVNSRKRIRIGVVIPSIGNPFFNDVLQGIHDREKKLTPYGVELAISEIKGYNPAEQLSAINGLLEEGIDGLAIMPINTPQIKERLRMLDLPIVTFNNDMDINRLAFIGCDYRNSGMISGDMAKLILHHGGKVVIVVGSFDIKGHMERLEGFKACVSAMPSMRIVAELENQDDDAISYSIVRDVLKAQHPDLIYFGAAGTEGGIRAVVESKQDVRIITVDDTKHIHTYLEQGIIAATITQQPYLQGDGSIRILYDYIANGKRPRESNCYTENQIKLMHS